MDAAPSGLTADTTTVAALAARDEATFARLVDHWASAMFRVARSHVSTDASAEEVVQDTWLAVLRGLDRFEGRSSLRTWVFSILVNKAKTRGVKEGRTLPFSSVAPEDAGPTVDPSRFQGDGEPHPGGWRPDGAPRAWVPSPEDAAVAAEVRVLLAQAIDALPERQRVVITLRDVQGLTSAEVSEVLEISPENQRVLLHRARAKVRAALESYYRPAVQV
jgi:RNA polymerase sigma-70 factor (ECF subfamily)